MPVKFIFFSFFSITMLESKILDLLCFYLNSLLHYSYQLYSIISYLSQSRFSRGVSDSFKEGLQLAHFGRPSNWLIWRVAVSPDLLLLKMITLAKVVLARLLQCSWKRSWLWVIFIRREDRAAIFFSRCFFKTRRSSASGRHSTLFIFLDPSEARDRALILAVHSASKRSIK